MPKASQLFPTLFALLSVSTCWLFAGLSPLPAQQSRYEEITEVVVVEVDWDPELPAGG